jgi:hypothetical protein
MASADVIAHNLIPYTNVVWQEMAIIFLSLGFCSALVEEV